jgi:hypothetical protein
VTVEDEDAVVDYGQRRERFELFIGIACSGSELEAREHAAADQHGAVDRGRAIVRGRLAPAAGRDGLTAEGLPAS